MMGETLNRRAFPRDEQGNLISKAGCQTPGCDHPNWHVCLVGKENKFSEAVSNLEAQLRAKRGKAHGKNIGALADGRDARWEQHRQETAPRDARLVARYEEGDVGIAALAREFGIAYQTARRILVSNGVTLRKRGVTVRSPREED